MDAEAETPEPGPFAKRVRVLAGYRGLSQLKTKAFDPDVRGTSIASFDDALSGRSQPPPALMESVARVLDIDPAVFDEYRCYLARQRMTPGVVSLADATARADAVLSSTPPTAAEVAAAAARRRAARSHKDGKARPRPAPTGPET